MLAKKKAQRLDALIRAATRVSTCRAPKSQSVISKMESFFGAQLTKLITIRKVNPIEKSVLRIYLAAQFGCCHRYLRQYL